jgi:hypothetical protein
MVHRTTALDARTTSVALEGGVICTRVNPNSYNIHVPEPSQIDYHEAIQVERVERARRLLDVGDVIATVESKLSAEGDVTQHPLYQLTLFLLDRATTVDGAQLYNDWRRLVLMAIDSLTDDALEALEG